eukprot:scaffold91726_cov63-Phaeocystis_antarctica.AAC.2
MPLTLTLTLTRQAQVDARRGQRHLAPHAALRRVVRRQHARIHSRVQQRLPHARRLRGDRTLHLQAQPGLLRHHHVSSPSKWQASGSVSFMRHAEVETAHRLVFGHARDRGQMGVAWDRRQTYIDRQTGLPIKTDRGENVAALGSSSGWPALLHGGGAGAGGAAARGAMRARTAVVGAPQGDD